MFAAAADSSRGCQRFRQRDSCSLGGDLSEVMDSAFMKEATGTLSNGGPVMTLETAVTDDEIRSLVTISAVFTWTRSQQLSKGSGNLRQGANDPDRRTPAPLQPPRLTDPEQLPH